MRSAFSFYLTWFVMFADLLIHSTASAQAVPIEVMFGDKNYLYQHSFSKKIAESQFAFFHTSSLYVYHGQDKATEIMSQSYLTYGLHANIKVAVGTFYASKPGFTPAASIQMFKKTNDLFVMLVPRVDLCKNGTGELMMLAEYRPTIGKRINLYSKVQMMSNYGPRHNRSYQNFRVGFDIAHTQFGLALNVDEFGSEKVTSRNWGVFLRYEL